MNYFSKFFLGALLIAGLASCNKAPSVITIANIAPLTGPAAIYGIPAKNAIDLATQEWNSKGGILGMQIHIIHIDDKNEPTEGQAAFSKAIDQNHVQAILGPVTSAVALAGLPLAQAAKIPALTYDATDEKVTPIGDYIFRSCIENSFQGAAMARYLYNDRQYKNVAVIYNQGIDYAKGLAESFKTTYTGLGGNLTAYEAHTAGTNDFKAPLTKILAGKPDAIYIPDFFDDSALIAKQVRELGYKGQLVGANGWDSPGFMKLAGASGDGGIYTSHSSVQDPRPVVQDFIKKYQAKYNAVPDVTAFQAYDGAYIMYEAIKRANSTDAAAIKAALAQTNYEGPAGKVTFDANRNAVKPAVIIEIKGDARNLLATVTP